MFKWIKLINYRTHKHTEIECGPVLLLIGNNNAGKSNLLAGIRHFAQLVARARPKVEGNSRGNGEEAGGSEAKADRSRLRPNDLFSHRYRLAPKDEPMAFACRWEDRNRGAVEYSVELWERGSAGNEVGCVERLRVREEHSDSWREVSAGSRQALNNRLELRESAESGAAFDPPETDLCRKFFRDMAQAFAYHLQPAFLKGEASREWPAVDPQRLVIPSQLGYEGANLQEILRHARESDERTFQRFIAALRRFDPSFHGIRADERRGQVVWEFDLGREGHGRLDEFPPAVVSDGLMKAAAIALLTTVRHPPALVMLEEIENGINPGNIQEFLGWLWRAAGTGEELGNESATQFILTSHSPSVLREFNDRLDCVYTVRLDRHGFSSDVRNLAVALDTLIGVGTVEGEIEEVEGKRVIRIPKYVLAELWYSGTIG